MQNQALYSLLGTRFGGDGRTNFGLPKLNGVAPLGFSPGTDVGKTGGSETVALNVTQIPSHSHTIKVNTATADQPAPADHYPAALPAPHLAFADAASPLTPMAAEVVGAAGGGQPHPNMQPYLAVNFCIALQGIYPSRP